jgi:Cu+-exporting ATPase
LKEVVMAHSDHPHDHGKQHHPGHGGGSCCSGPAATKAETVVRDPVCGMTVDPEAGKPSLVHEGHTYHFCCESCRTKFAADPESYITAKDPVCGMKVDRASARHFLRYQGEKHYFCSARCLEKFEAEPEKYLGDRPAPEPMPAGTQYTCPMHPEIVQDGPGDCPLCGMALEPMGVPTGDEGPNPELVDFTRRFWVSVTLALPLVVISMGPMVGLPVRDWLGERVAVWAEFALGLDPQPQPQHVDADLHRSGGGLSLQCRGDAVPRPVPARGARPRGVGAGLFRGIRSHHRTGIPRPGA